MPSIGTKSWMRERRLYWQDKYKLNKGCEFCGYTKHPKSLSFDHLVPEDKNPIVKNKGTKEKGTNGGGMWQLTDPKIPLKEMVSEWRKCRILCMNCHMEERHSRHKIKKIMLDTP